MIIVIHKGNAYHIEWSDITATKEQIIDCLEKIDKKSHDDLYQLLVRDKNARNTIEAVGADIMLIHIKHELFRIKDRLMMAEYYNRKEDYRQ